jgi:hypothetical protein
MGGLIAGYYAKYCSKDDKIHVDHVISIGSPWQGTPNIDYFWNLGGPCSKKRD